MVTFFPKPLNRQVAAISDSLKRTQKGLGIGASGDTHDAIGSGQFVYVRDHSSLAEGLYKSKAAIAQDGALSTSNLTADDSGGLNDLQSQITSLNSNLTNITKVVTKTITLDNSGEWGGWNSDVGMAGYVLLGAYPDAWAPTTVICDKDGYFSISCPSKASSSLAFKLLGIKANVVH